MINPEVLIRNHSHPVRSSYPERRVGPRRRIATAPTLLGRDGSHIFPNLNSQLCENGNYFSSRHKSQAFESHTVRAWRSLAALPINSVYFCHKNASQRGGHRAQNICHVCHCPIFIMQETITTLKLFVSFLLDSVKFKLFMNVLYWSYKTWNHLTEKCATSVKSYMGIPPVRIKLLIAFSHPGSVTLQIVKLCSPVRYCPAQHLSP